MIQVQLEMLGWDGFFASQPCAGVPGRVAGANREWFSVWTEAGEVDAGVSGCLRNSGLAWPAVGDWVSLRAGAAVIEQVFARRTVLSRKEPGRAMREQVLAANIDVLFIVNGLDGDYNERRMERYLLMARQSGARPVIVLNKSDLAGNYGIDVAEKQERLGDWARAPVVAVSALDGDGLGSLEGLVAAGETAALVGSSGVGMSTIVNRLVGEERQPTREVRSGDDRGRHTTTGRSMLMMKGGWLLIDMPGLREIQAWGPAEQVDGGFEDIHELAGSCRFRDCTHGEEPGCAVRTAGVDQGRLENYRKMGRELEYLERKTDKRLMSETRARWKAIHKAMRNDPRRKW
jgi:ribosome biogenesis GTPase